MKWKETKDETVYQTLDERARTRTRTRTPALAHAVPDYFQQKACAVLLDSSEVLYLQKTVHPGCLRVTFIDPQ
jgi:hypothetical protein